MEHEVCPHCGAKLMARWERVSDLLARTLVYMHDTVVRTKRNSIHVSTELSLTSTQYNNFQKLRFHGLIAKVKENGELKSGYWLVTRRGHDFVMGTLAIPVKVKVFRNRVIDHDKQLVYMSDVTKCKPFLDKMPDFKYEPVMMDMEKPVFTPITVPAQLIPDLTPELMRVSGVPAHFDKDGQGQLLPVKDQMYE